MLLESIENVVVNTVSAMRCLLSFCSCSWDSRFRLDMMLSRIFFRFNSSVDYSRHLRLPLCGAAVSMTSAYVFSVEYVSVGSVSLTKFASMVGFKVTVDAF